MSKPKNSDKVGNLMHALADPTRLRIVEILSNEGKQTASNIYEQFSVSHPAMSQHMGVLLEAGVVSVEKKAQYRVYRVNHEAILEIEDWTGNIKRMWERRFRALEEVLEKQKRNNRSEVETDGRVKQK